MLLSHRIVTKPLSFYIYIGIPTYKVIFHKLPKKVSMCPLNKQDKDYSEFSEEKNQGTEIKKM